MIKLRQKFRDDFQSVYIDDIEHIVHICATNGYQISSKDAYEIWNQYSDDLCASWIMLPEDAEVLKIILEYSVPDSVQGEDL